MKEIMFRAIVEKYGDCPDISISQRFFDELYLYNQRGVQGLFTEAYETAQSLKKEQIAHYVAGTGASSFLTYLLGVSKANPLPAHYYCPSCKKVIWGTSKFGRDLPKRNCECGVQLIGDGYDIKKEFFWCRKNNLLGVAVRPLQITQDLSLWNKFSFQKRLDLWAFYQNCINNRDQLFCVEDCEKQIQSNPFLFLYREDIIDYLDDFGLPIVLAVEAADHICRGKIYQGENLRPVFNHCFSKVAKKEIKQIRRLYSRAHAIEYLVAQEKFTSQDAHPFFLACCHCPSSTAR